MQHAWNNNNYTHRKSQIKRKTDWAGVSLGDAFNATVTWHEKLAAQKLFYTVCELSQRAAILAAGGEMNDNIFKIKPQLAPCGITSYPKKMASYAAIGLTAYLEFKNMVDENYSDELSILTPFLINLCLKDKEVPPIIYNKSFQDKIVYYIRNRLILEDLSRHPGLQYVEWYRLFIASENKLQFKSFFDILDAVIVYGDILPDWQLLDLHPLTLRIIKDVQSTSRPFHEELKNTASERFDSLLQKWLVELNVCLSPYLSTTPQKRHAKIENNPEHESVSSRANSSGRTAELKNVPSNNVKVAPLDKMQAPRLDLDRSHPEPSSINISLEPFDKDYEMQMDFPGNSPISDDSDIAKTLDTFTASIENAVKQDDSLESSRSDLLSETLRNNSFTRNPIEGVPLRGHRLTMTSPVNNEKLQGEVFDCFVKLSEDIPECQKLRKEAAPITEKLRGNLYPNVQDKVEVAIARTKGTLDPRRLALSPCSEAIFKQYTTSLMESQNGKPLVLIACDSSASMNYKQMKMLKLLLTGWLDATVKSQVQVAAAIYRSGTLHNENRNALVEWVFHPHKTPASSNIDAIRAITSLPNSGRGAQRDYLSLQHIFNETLPVVQGRRIYMIIISDVCWNSCFPGIFKNGEEEILSFLHHANQATKGNLHTTLVALGADDSKVTPFNGIIDKIVHVSEDDLGDVACVASQIGSYVSSCIRDHQKCNKTGR